MTRKTVNDQLVSRYVAQLSADIGFDGRFSALISKMRRDKSLRAGEVKAIAKAFAFASCRTKADAFAKIVSKHSALEMSRAKVRATAGRIAG